MKMLAVRKILTNNKYFTSVKYLENSSKNKKREEIFKRTKVCSTFRTDFVFKKIHNVIIIRGLYQK